MSNQSEYLAKWLQSLATEMLAFCGPIFFVPGLSTRPNEMITNGTFSLIDTGERRVLVTCHHVWQAFLECRAQNSLAALALSLGDGDANVVFAAPERQLIDSDPDLDLAVFDFEPSRILLDGDKIKHQKSWFYIRDWPIRNVRVGAYVALMGFPGSQIVKETELCTFKTQLLPFKVTSVGQRQFWVLNEGENIEVFSGIKGCLGGLSGSPAYALDEEGATLVGFVRAGSTPDTGASDKDEVSFFSGSLYLTHASFLQRDGTLLRT